MAELLLKCLKLFGIGRAKAADAVDAFERLAKRYETRLVEVERRLDECERDRDRLHRDVKRLEEKIRTLEQKTT